MGTTGRFDPQRHHRRSIRLPGYDYRQAGAYFVTICTRERELLFGRMANEEVILNEYGQIAESCWRETPNHFPHTDLDTYVIMPNHIHGIIVITDAIGRGEASPGDPLPTNRIATAGNDSAPTGITRDASPLHGPSPGSLGAIVGNFKSVTARRINRLRHTPGAPVWQRNYYEHIVRTEEALQAIRQYIVDNPLRWALDTYNAAATERDPQAAELWNMLQAEAGARR